ncbi:hypothetical protein [Pseudomonas sp. GD04042]|uniref:hypothetical protein n=1 Tax=unclassified Pseudomonas TaxID=196821 RepID=UPI0032609107
MTTIHDPMKSIISLHGLGFVQVLLQGGQRLHVWHPDLPRRRCFEHSAIHSHRFSFESQVLVGEQINISYRAIAAADEQGATHRLYLHEGPRSACGGRPWTPNAPVIMREEGRSAIRAGDSYRMYAYDFHRTEPGGDGRVATLMTKTGEGSAGAMSSCLIGIEPDTDFDRFQLSAPDLWAYVLDVLGHGEVSATLRCLGRQPPELEGVADQLQEGNGFWRSCTGCYETEDGHPVGQYLYSKSLHCMLGAGCSECGGIGAVWDSTDYAAQFDEEETQHTAACNHQLAPCPCCGMPGAYVEVEPSGYVVTCTATRPCVTTGEIRYALGGDVKQELAEVWNCRCPADKEPAT